MPVFKINKTNNYTVMSNYHLQDKSLSLKAKGLLSIMLSLPKNWDYSINGLVSIVKENETAVKSALNELKDNGYLEVVKLFPNETENGRLDYVYNIYEVSKEQEGKKQGVENQPLEILAVENQGQYNTNILNTNKLNTNNNIYELEFEKLWGIYPNKKGKTNALKSYIKSRKKGISYEDIYKGVINYLDYIKVHNTKEQYVKHGSTWFNQECWNDTYSINEDLPKWFVQEIKDEELSEEERIKYLQGFD